MNDTTPFDTTPLDPTPRDPEARDAAEIDTGHAAASAADGERLPRPRIRTGAAIWGLLLIGLGGWVLWIGSSAVRRADALEAVLTLSPLGWTVVIVVAVGATIALLALAAVIRRLQARR